jgi:hypothetical protein
MLRRRDTQGYAEAIGQISGNSPQRASKATENLSQISKSPERDLNPGPTRGANQSAATFGPFVVVQLFANRYLHWKQTKAGRFWAKNENSRILLNSSRNVPFGCGLQLGELYLLCQWEKKCIHILFEKSAEKGQGTNRRNGLWRRKLIVHGQ